MLTAAHCLTADISAFSIGAGEPGSIAPLVGMRSVAAIDAVVHPTYGGLLADAMPIGGDVALVRLARDMIEVPLATIASEAPPRAGTQCSVIGYGRHDRNGAPTYYEKRSATVILSQSDASSVTIVSGDGVSDQGDSGGPLVCNGAIAGTTSFGFKRRGQGSADWVRYMRSDVFLPWMREHVARWR